MHCYISDEQRHAGRGLKIFVLVIPKEVLADTIPAEPSFRIAPAIKNVGHFLLIGADSQTGYLMVP